MDSNKGPHSLGICPPLPQNSHTLLRTIKCEAYWNFGAKTAKHGFVQQNRDYLEYLESLGFAAQPWGQEPFAAPADQRTQPAGPKVAVPQSEVELPFNRPTPVPTGAENQVWETLRVTCMGCVKCDLSASRTHVAFGVGNHQARLMFIGEGPGADEDRLGEPFVGQGGQLLDKMIIAMKLKRSDVYLANVVKCRPPGNRNPEPVEIAQCFGYLKQQIELVSPDIIVGLGSIAAHTLLSLETPISKLRGKFYPLDLFKNREGKTVMFMPTFHPAYLLRNPEAKKAVWEDLKLVMSQMSLT